MNPGGAAGTGSSHAPGFVTVALTLAGLLALTSAITVVPLALVNDALIMPAICGSVVALFGAMGARTPTWVGRFGAASAWALVAAVALGLGVLAGQWIAWGALFMAVVGALYGLSYRFGMNGPLYVVAIFTGPVVVYPTLVTPGFTPGDPVPVGGAGAMAAAVAAGGVLGAVVFATLVARLPLAPPTREPWAVAGRLAVGLALLLGTATAVVLSWDRSSTGPWLMVTIVVLAQTDPVASLRRSWQRVAGTLIGAVLAAGIGLTLGALLDNANTVGLVIGMVFLVVALAYKLSHLAAMAARGYWVYALLLTIAVVLLTAPGGTLSEQTAEARMLWTLVGAVAIVATTVVFTRTSARPAQPAG